MRQKMHSLLWSRHVRSGALAAVVAGMLAGMPAGAVHADTRILATGGASTIEGSAGGGIVPWAVLAGYGSEGEWGASAFGTQVRLRDYALDTKGLALSYDNRLEVSYARQHLDLGTLADALGMPGHTFRQDVFGLKYRLHGDLIYGSLPQFTLGLQHKRHQDFGVPQAVGAVRDSDNELYLSAAKLWLAGLFDRNVFANATVRYTRANQGGLLGFGGDRNDDRELVVEAAAGIFLQRHLAIGAEFRQHPENLSFGGQDHWRDLFIAWFPAKRVSLVGAWADLGTVATLPNQRGWYLSLEFAY